MIDTRKKVYDVIVVGGGASGMMAAARAASRGLSVLLLEKNKRLGEKLRISGGGRCNILNKEEDERVLVSKYGNASKYLHSLFAEFSMKDTVSFFEERSLPLKVEALKRAFPQTEKAEDVEELLEKELVRTGAQIKMNSGVVEVLHENNSITSIKSKEETFTAKEYIFAVGGASHPETGSTGDGFKWLKILGHKIVTPTPSLVPLAVEDSWVKSLSGTALSESKVTFLVDNKKVFAMKGRILFTHFGLSGPLILNNSKRVADLLPTGMVIAEIDMFPSIDHGELDAKLVTLFDSSKNKEFKNVLPDFLPEGMSKGILPVLTFDITTKVHSVSKDDRKSFIKLCKALPCTISGLMGFEKAIVADGGVPCEEVDFKTMRSKKVGNLYLTGDLLHINRPSGGYSLQLCWSTGYVAGNSVCKQDE